MSIELYLLCIDSPISKVTAWANGVLDLPGVARALDTPLDTVLRDDCPLHKTPFIRACLLTGSLADCCQSEYQRLART